MFREFLHHHLFSFWNILLEVFGYLFCSSTAFLLQSRAELDIQHLENFTFSLIFQPLREDFRYRIYYLLPKSRLSITACRIAFGERSSQYDDDVEIGIIIGADIFKVSNSSIKFFNCIC